MAGFEQDLPTMLRTALAAALLAAAPLASAATDADQRYHDERAACRQRPETQRGNCLREAAAARQAARAGELNRDVPSGSLTQRCNALPAAERDACIRRARGEGAVSGSVEEGGILREYREIILPPAAPPQEARQEPYIPTPGPATDPAMPAPASTHPAPAGVMLQRVP